MEKRLEELRHAHSKLELLVKAIVLVNMDATAREILEEVLDSTADGTGTHTADLQDLLTIAYAHAKVRIEKETRRAIDNDVESIIKSPPGTSLEDALKAGRQ